MSESYVYIDAPSLDNSDQSKFLLDTDLQIVQAGDESKGSVAKFPLYEKFLSTEWNTALSYNSLARTEIRPGIWAARGENVENGGDYCKGNVAKVYSRIFSLGRLLKLKFRFYNKDEINVENRNSDTHPSQVANYEAYVPRVAVFESLSKEDGTIDKDKFKFVSYASYESQDEDGGTYALEKEVYITGKALTSLNYSFVFIFLTANHSAPEFVIGNTYSHLNLREEGLGNDNVNSDDYVGLRSVPRGSLDNMSYICGTHNTNNGIGSGQNRLLDFDFLINVDLINEYIGENSDNHHLNISDVIELNKLRYSGPLFPDLSVYKRKNTAAGYGNADNTDFAVYLSDYSLSRGNAISLKNKIISAIQIPFKYSTVASDYENSAMISYQFDTGSGGILHSNRQIFIAQGKEDGSLPTEEDWICSDNIIAYSYFQDNMIYQCTYNNGKGIKYNGYGLYFRAARPTEDNSGFNNFGIHYYESLGDDSKYAYSPDDIIRSTRNSEGYNATAHIDVIFDYKTRKDWFDYIENKTSNLTSSGGNSSIFVNSISLGDWRIAVNADGNLEIYHISATEDKDKSIFYIPTSN